MSKERLEEIKEHFRWTLNNSLVPRLSDSDTEWLIEQAEQAERVQELESENRILRTVAESNKYIGEQYLEQNKRYREILSYVREIDCVDWNKEELAEIARQALEGEK